MDKKELQKAQNIIDVLFYDDKVLTQWQHTLLENVISIAQTKLRKHDVSGQVCGCSTPKFYQESYHYRKCEHCGKREYPQTLR